jgi:hypothetical protein
MLLAIIGGFEFSNVLVDAARGQIEVSRFNNNDTIIIGQLAAPKTQHTAA